MLFNNSVLSYCCSVAKLYLTLYDPIDCSMPGLPFPHHLPEFTQFHVHWISDTIQLSHPLSPSSCTATMLNSHLITLYFIQFSSVQSLSCVQLFVTSWATARQVPLSSTVSQSLFKLMSIETVIPSNYLILCHPCLLIPLVFQHQGLFQWVGSLHQVAKVLEFQLQHQSFQWLFMVDFL